MSFSKLRDELKSKPLEEVTCLQDFHTAYFSDSFKGALNDLNDKYINHLFNDLSGLSSNANFEGFLNGSYMQTNEFAKNCIQLAYHSKSLYGLRIKGWTDSALKCFDNFILILIQEVLKEKIKSTSNLGTEREKYKHLIDKGGELHDIGIGLEVVYQQRDMFSHIEIINVDGTRIQKPLSKKKINALKEIILDSFKKSLLALEKQMV